MSIVNCLITNLPAVLEKALEDHGINGDTAQAFINDVITTIRSDSGWSIFHPEEDIEMLKNALESAAQKVGITWSKIAEVVVDAAVGAAEKCVI